MRGLYLGALCIEHSAITSLGVLAGESGVNGVITSKGPSMSPPWLLNPGFP